VHIATDEKRRVGEDGKGRRFEGEATKEGKIPNQDNTKFESNQSGSENIV